MGFLLLCIGLWLLLARQVPIDTFGWLMLVATGWFIGYIDAQWFRRWDKKHRQDMILQPPPVNDHDLFRS